MRMSGVNNMWTTLCGYVESREFSYIQYLDRSILDATIVESLAHDLEITIYKAECSDCND